ncbi:hypothetical protein [Methanoregula sp. UBA64]|jgi:hypothetical protein|uniref:hypothetical protein n=1 Tax=Methanoregula sp. UBA64 TaxID=1915554 RepID=UPI0025E8CABD|nr:hypothetical protein [Methanoregula sp. UBA64]
MDTEQKLRLPVRQTLIFGCISGAALAAGYLFLTWLWQVLLPEARWFSGYYGLHLILYFSVALALAGLLVGERSGAADRSWLWIAGMISGIVTALVFFGIITFLEILTGTSAFLLSSAQWMGIFGASVILPAVCAEFREPRSAHGPDPGTAGGLHKNPAKLKIHGIMAAIFLAIVILPPLGLYAGTSAGLVWGQPAGYLFNDNVVATRTGPDSISLVMHPDLRATFVTAPYVERITLGGVQVGSQDSINASGRADTIDPPAGLAYREGATATISGIDAAGNSTVPVRLMVIMTYPDTGAAAVVCDREI